MTEIHATELTPHQKACTALVSRLNEVLSGQELDVVIPVLASLAASALISDNEGENSAPLFLSLVQFYSLVQDVVKDLTTRPEGASLN